MLLEAASAEPPGSWNRSAVFAAGRNAAGRAASFKAAFVACSSCQDLEEGWATS